MIKKGIYTKVSKKFPPTKITVGKPLKTSWQSKLKSKVIELEYDRNILNNIILNHLDFSKLDKGGLALYESIKKKIPVNHMTIQRRTISITGKGIGIIPYNFKLTNHKLPKNDKKIRKNNK